MNDRLHTIAIISLIVAAICALIIAVDIMTGHRQQMWIMDLVWPITALYSGPLGLRFYYKVGRHSARKMARQAKRRGQEPPSKQKPFRQSVAVGATHCGSGGTLGNLIAEWFIFFVPLALFGRTIFAA